MTELGYLGIADTARAFREGALNPVVVLSHLLDRIDRFDDHLHAFLHIDRQAAMGRAEEAAEEIARGRYRGPMHGIAIAVKDIIDVAGQATTCHSAIRAGHVADRHAAVIARLLEAGAIVLGKTALHEFATGGPAFDLPWPPARNPWNTALHPGGSSSGSAVAVAAGMAPAALGTDTGGSIRNPATCCGIVGLKPTYDLIERNGVFPLSFSLDHVGLLARSVEDVAILLDAAAPPSGDADSKDEAANRYAAALAQDLRRGIGGMRVGVIEHFYKQDDVADAGIDNAIDDALDVLRELGAHIEPVQLSALKVWADCGRVIQQAEQYVVHEKWLQSRPQDYCSLSRRKLVAGAFLPAPEYVMALQAREILRGELEAVMRHFDVLVTASGMTLPCAIDDPVAISASYERHARMPFNVTGAPALSLPIGFTEDGLPLGMQMTARCNDERTLLRVAAAYEDVTRWRVRTPPV